MRYVRPALLLSLMVATGCASIRGYPTQITDSDKVVAAMASYLDDTNATVTNCLVPPVNNPPDPKACRNRIIEGRLYAIDARYRDFIRDLNEDDHLTNLGFDALQLTLGGLGSTLGGTAVKASLAAASTGVTGARSSYDQTVLAKQTAQALIGIMDGSRANIRKLIIQGETLPADSYLLSTALNQIAEYEQAGTVPNAVQVLASAAGTASNTSSTQLTAAMKLAVGLQ